MFRHGDCFVNRAGRVTFHWLACSAYIIIFQYSDFFLPHLSFRLAEWINTLARIDPSLPLQRHDWEISTTVFAISSASVKDAEIKREYVEGDDNSLCISTRSLSTFICLPLLPRTRDKWHTYLLLWIKCHEIIIPLEKSDCLIGVDCLLLVIKRSLLV